jgi:hypothetical protein
MAKHRTGLCHYMYITMVTGSTLTLLPCCHTLAFRFRTWPRTTSTTPSSWMTISSSQRTTYRGCMPSARPRRLCRGGGASFTGRPTSMGCPQVRFILCSHVQYRGAVYFTYTRSHHYNSLPQNGTLKIQPTTTAVYFSMFCGLPAVQGKTCFDEVLTGADLHNQ